MGLFKKAVVSDSKLRLAITGPSGSGKTWTALAIATALAPGKVALVDTEHGSAAKYANDFEFDVAEMHKPYKVEKYLSVIKEAAEAGYEVLIIDSLSHAWSGPGGVLEVVDNASKKFNGNSYYAWREGTPLQQSLIDGIVTAPVHIIATMRAKEEYAETVENGRKTYRKVGTAPIQRDGMSYEMDIVFEMNLDHEAIVAKTRCSALADQVLRRPGADVAQILRTWLAGEANDTYVAQIAPQNAVIAATEDANPFEDSTPYYVRDWHRMTGKPYDLVQWLSSLHKESKEPCTTKQYQYLAGLLDSITGNQHGYVLSVLCQAEIDKTNLPGKSAASALLKLLPETVKDEQGNEVPNKQYRADVVEMLSDMAQQQPVAEAA